MEEIRRDESGKSQDKRFVQSPLCVCGACTHNLKNVNVKIPRNQTTVLAGPSGSGKSSLAFDTIFAEGQRQYVESLSTYSRQFLNQLPRPEIDAISGLQPTVAIKQIPSEPNPRSTVATVAEIYDFLRLLYARVGIAHCFKCGRPIQRLTTNQIIQAILRLPRDTRFMLLAPVVHEKLGAHADTIQRLIRSGRTRARIDGVIVELAQAPELDPRKPHSIDVVMDRLILREDTRSRLEESLDEALKIGGGLVCCFYEKERQVTEKGSTRSVWKDILFSDRYSCPKCNVSYVELEPRSFSFNSPYGACPKCGGLGRRDAFNPERLILDANLTLDGGALALGKGLSTGALRKISKELEEFKRLEPNAYDAPMSSWEESVRKFFFFGQPQERDDGVVLTQEEIALLNSDVTHTTKVSEDSSEEKKMEDVMTSDIASLVEVNQAQKTVQRGRKLPSFKGLINVLDEIFSESKSANELKYLEYFRGSVPCNECYGTRIRREARSVTVDDKTLGETTAMSVAQALKWFEGLTFDELQRDVATPIVEQILSRLRAMSRLRLDYLTLDRAADTLSGGELQRVRLTTALGNNLSGVCYILDEPTTGLHPRDTERLLETFESLKEHGNTVVLVEHHEDVLRNADWLVDFGPGAGALGGKILAEGTPEEVSNNPNSLTGQFLSGRTVIPVPKKRRKAIKTRSLTLEGVRTNNLKDVTLTLPLGLFVCVTGVSGSGKSSLFSKTLVPALKKRVCYVGDEVEGASSDDERRLFRSIRGASRIDKLVEVTQAPIGRNARSNPASYSDVFTEIRQLFASTRDAKAHGFKNGRFSFNVAGGRCEECQGLGALKVENLFLPDTYVECPVCEGKRFNSQTLQVRYNNKTIADVLEMSFDEASEFFSAHRKLKRYIDSFRDVGLGYLTLGQSSATLSGGEAQRIKLAKELGKQETGDTLYLLDEPTSGLHPVDIRHLLDVLQGLVDRGNTVVVIEHSTDVMKVADWIIDMGPEGGEGGGQIIASGTPEEIAALENNATGRFLRSALERGKHALV